MALVFFHADVAVALKFTVTKPDGTAYDLTGSTVTLRTERTDGTTASFSCTVTDALNGKCERIVAAGDFTPGSYRAQLKVTTGPAVFHTDVFAILVAEALP